VSSVFVTVRPCTAELHVSAGAAVVLYCVYISEVRDNNFFTFSSL